MAKREMSNIEKIRQEIERRMEELERDKYINIDAKTCRQSELKYLERFIDSLPEEKPSEDLEEAAKEYATDTLPFGDETYVDSGAYRDFIAGAEWMRKKDVEDMYMSDNRHFIKCYEQGKVDMKVEMMKGAADGEIGYWNQRGLSIRLDQSLEKLGYDEDTKVKIIIVKK